VISNALRSLWAEPRAADAPVRVSRDWVLVGVVMVAALLEGVLRDDVAWRPFATIVAVGLAPVLLWRRTRPLACVVVAFGTALVLGLVSLAGGPPQVGLDTMIYVLVLVYALVRWGSGREIVIGLAVVLVAAVVGTVADYTGPANVIGGFAVLAAAAADGAAFRYRAESWRRALEQIHSRLGWPSAGSKTRHIAARRDCWWTGPATLGLLETGIRCFREGGFSVLQAAHAISVVDSYVHGFVLQEVNLPFRDESELAAMTTAIMETFPASEFPYLFEMTLEHVLKPGYDYGKEFDSGLQAVLDGVAAMLTDR
jgi:hypothetical protein